MTAILKVDTIQDTSGNNIINESSDTITIGASGDTVAIPSGGKLTAPGHVIQAICTTKTDTYSESISSRATGSAITGLTATITPTSASSKLLVFAVLQSSRSGLAYGNFILHRDGSAVLVGDSAGSRLPVTVGDNLGPSNTIMQQNSSSFGQVTAGSTNATTFDIRLENSGSGSSQTFYVNRSSTDTDNNTFTRSISSIMVMEVAT